MKLQLVLLLVSVASAVPIILEKKPDLTANCYQKTPVATSLSQNRFLKLPNSPVCSAYGFFPVDVQVPYSIDTYVWEVSGYYEAKSTGTYSFAIDRAKIASIQIGSKRLMPQVYEETAFEYDDVLPGQTLFHKSPVSLLLLKDRFYFVKIVYIAGADRVPIYVTEPLGFKQDLDYNIQEAVFDPKQISLKAPLKPSKSFAFPSYFHRVGFFLVVYYLPRERLDYESVIRNYQPLEKVHEGYFMNRMEQIVVPLFTATLVREVLGHFRPPSDGKYSINIAGSVIAAVQIGPKQAVRDAFYVVDDDWKVLDTRSCSSNSFELEGSFFYPFRIILLGNDQHFELDISVYDPRGQSIDLFGIWKAQCKVKGPIAEDKFELFGHNTAPCQCFCLGQKKKHGLSATTTVNNLDGSVGTEEALETGQVGGTDGLGCVAVQLLDMAPSISTLVEDFENSQPTELVELAR